MPHLSPMHWIMALISTTVILLTITSILWWTQKPQFRTHKSKTISTPTKWYWL